jgi:hypothetical protein
VPVSRTKSATSDRAAIVGLLDDHDDSANLAAVLRVATFLITRTDASDAMRQSATRSTRPRAAVIAKARRVQPSLAKREKAAAPEARNENSLIIQPSVSRV